MKPQDRMTFFDAVSFEATVNPGVGNYNIRVTIISHRDDHRLK